MNLEKVFLIFFGIVLCVASAVIYNERYTIINKMVSPQPEMGKIFNEDFNGDFKHWGEAQNRYNDRYKQWQNELDTLKVAISIMSGVLFLFGLWMAIFQFVKPKKCPQCAGTIWFEAIKCRFCGADLTKNQQA